MGRHSAASDDDEDVVPDESTPATTDDEPGRHHSAPEASQPKPRIETGTHGDLKLLRENPALRARCAAAVLVPFLLYTAVVAVLGRADFYLVWVWIPTVTAGVSVGAFLDVAHRRARRDE